MLYTIRDLVTLGNSYLKEKEVKNEPCNRALLKNIAVYFTQIFNILGLNSKPEEIGFSSSTESGGANKEEVVMPYLQALANFRENVRKEAIGKFLNWYIFLFSICFINTFFVTGIKAGKILSECDLLRNEVLPELGVRLEDKENHTVIKLVDKNELKREMEQLKIAEEKKKAEKEKKKAEADAKKAEKEKQNKINPMEMFKDQTDKFSKFDEKVGYCIKFFFNN